MEMRIKAAGGGVDALLTFSGDAGSSDYDPSALADYEPPTPALLAVKGIWEKLPSAGAVTDNLAKFAFFWPVEIPAMLPDDTTVTVGGTLASLVMTGGTLYLVKVARLRTYLGALDGYSLELERGPRGQ